MGGLSRVTIGLEKEGVDCSGVLGELDNNWDGPMGMREEKQKSGSWKRRARLLQKPEGKENVLSAEPSVSSMGGKRALLLRDEERIQESHDRAGKKVKAAVPDLIVSENSVEEASRKWPQSDK